MNASCGTWSATSAASKNFDRPIHRRCRDWKRNYRICSGPWRSKCERPSSSAQRGIARIPRWALGLGNIVDRSMHQHEIAAIQERPEQILNRLGTALGMGFEIVETQIHFRAAGMPGER